MATWYNMVLSTKLNKRTPSLPYTYFENIDFRRTKINESLIDILILISG